MNSNNKTYDYDKYANVIIRAFRKYIYLIKKNIAYGGDIGLGKWLVICERKHFEGMYDDKLLWLGNIIGVTGWKIWGDRNNSSKTWCICIYCGVNEHILKPNEQYKWILDIGTKILKSRMIQSICIKDAIYFKDNFKTARNIYSHNSNNASTLKLNFNSECDFID